MSFGGSTAPCEPSPGDKIRWKLDIHPADIQNLIKGDGVFVREGREKFAPEDTAELQQKAGRDAERKRQKHASRSDVITPDLYDKFQISFLDGFPDEKLD